MRSARPGVWGLSAGAFVLGLVLLPFTQPEQVRRRLVEDEFRADRITAALTLMSEHERGDFPPHWEPPPRLGYPSPAPPILEVIDSLTQKPQATWVEAIYLDKLERGQDRHWYLPNDERGARFALLTRLRRQRADLVPQPNDDPLTRKLDAMISELRGEDPTLK